MVSLGIRKSEILVSKVKKLDCASVKDQLKWVEYFFQHTVLKTFLTKHKKLSILCQTVRKKVNVLVSDIKGRCVSVHLYIRVKTILSMCVLSHPS